MNNSSAARVHLAMAVGCGLSAGLTAVWFATYSGPMGRLAEWARRHAYFESEPHMWPVVAVLGPGMLGLALAMLLLIAWSLLLILAIQFRCFGDPKEARTAAAAWWRFQVRQRWILLLFEFGAVLALFGLFTWLAGRDPTLRSHYDHFIRVVALRNPDYKLAASKYREVCWLFAWPTLTAGATMVAAAVLLWGLRWVRRDSRA